jgi:hypothetical protein
MVNKKLSVKNIRFNESYLSVLKYFTLLQNGRYGLDDFQSLLKEIENSNYDDNLDSPYKLQELTIITHLKNVIKSLNK